jgi:RNA polymerase sigma factor (sigma-70 family)
MTTVQGGGSATIAPSTDAAAAGLGCGDLAELRSTLMGVAFPRAGSHDAEDAVQEALFRACADPSIELEQASGWLRVVTRNAAVDIARRRGRDEAMLRRLAPRQMVSPDHADDVVDRELAGWLEGMLDRLAAPQRTVVALLAGGKSLRDAAAEMGISVKAAEGHLTRARKALRSWSS